jgi:hypothetical protein
MVNHTNPALARKAVFESLSAVVRVAAFAFASLFVAYTVRVGVGVGGDHSDQCKEHGRNEETHCGLSMRFGCEATRVV